MKSDARYCCDLCGYSGPSRACHCGDNPLDEYGPCDECGGLDPFAELAPGVLVCPGCVERWRRRLAEVGVRHG